MPEPYVYWKEVTWADHQGAGGSRLVSLARAETLHGPRWRVTPIMTLSPGQSVEVTGDVFDRLPPALRLLADRIEEMERDG